MILIDLILQVLLKEFCKTDNVSYKVPGREVESCLQEGQSALLIGDRALAAAQNCPRGFKITDLGALWYHFTGLPFVFALWILRREAVEKAPVEVSALAAQLQASRGYAFNHLADMAAQLARRTGFSAGHLEEYWRGMSYDLTDGHVEGLRLYFALCHKHGLLEREPDFHFFAAR